MRRGTGTYPPGWPDFARALKEAAGWCCARCHHPHDTAAGYMLTVHHLTMAKDEPFEHWWAFAVLCQRCHLHVQSKVIMERVWLFDHSAWFRAHVAGYYAHLRGLPDDRASVEANMDDLLDWTKLPEVRCA